MRIAGEEHATAVPAESIHHFKRNSFRIWGAAAAALVAAVIGIAALMEPSAPQTPPLSIATLNIDDVLVEEAGLALGQETWWTLSACCPPRKRASSPRTTSRTSFCNSGNGSILRSRPRERKLFAGQTGFLSSPSRIRLPENRFSPQTGTPDTGTVGTPRCPGPHCYKAFSLPAMAVPPPVFPVSIRNGRQSFQTFYLAPELVEKTAIWNRGFIRQEGRSYQAR